MRRRTTPTVLLVSITLTVQPMLAQNSTMTAVPGIRVGHFALSKRPTGCTVVLAGAGAIAGMCAAPRPARGKRTS